MDLISLQRNDRIFLGEGLFETLKVHKGKPKQADLHWQRLTHAAERLMISLPLNFEAWEKELIMHLQVSKITDGGIKAILSSGQAPRSLTARGEHGQFIYQAFSYTVQKKPLRLIEAPWRRDAANPLYSMKTINYLEAILAKKQALLQDADDVLFFNHQGQATESSTSNLFLIQNNKILTPSSKEGLLQGITRNTVLSLCQQAKLTCIETPLSKNQILSADALFLTNTLQGIQSVLSFETQKYNPEHPLIGILRNKLDLFP